MGSTIISRDNNPEKLDESEQAVLLAKVFQTPDPARHGTCAWTLADLCDFAEVRFGKRLSTSGMSGVLQRPGLSHRKARSVHPKTDPQAQAKFQKRTLGRVERRPTRPSACGFRTRLGSERRAGFVIAGGKRGSHRLAVATRGSNGTIFSARSRPKPATRLASFCPWPTQQRCRSSSPYSLRPCPETSMPSWFSTRPAGMAPTSSRSQTTALWPRCRPTIPRSIQSNGFGSISDNAT